MLEMKVARALGAILATGSVVFAIFYVLWFFGALPLDPELAVKLPVLAMVLTVCGVVTWLGYVMATAPSPAS